MMKMKKLRKIKKISNVIWVILLLMSCNEEFTHGPIGHPDNTIPQPVSNLRVLKNTPGGAIITYEVLNDVDIQYVKAVYKNSKGIESEVKGSAYVNTLEIKGLGDTLARKVKVYAVNKKENVSEPVEVTINPMTPPVVKIFQSLQYEPAFGGFALQFKNVDRGDVSLNVLYKDTLTNNMNYYQSFYTSLAEGVYNVRGLPAKHNQFGVYVRDRWENSSDTIYFSLTPWPESLLDKKLFKSLYLSGDVAWTGWGGRPEYAFDDVLVMTNYAHTDYPLAFPHRYSLDLGVTAKISRFKMYQRPGETVLYEHGNPKRYRIYARATNPASGNPDDVFDGWTLVMECNSFKPSGLPPGQNSVEDIEYSAAGEEYEFPRSLEPVRYIRFEFLESWSGMECTIIGEFTFWGQVIE